MPRCIAREKIRVPDANSEVYPRYAVTAMDRIKLRMFW